MIDPRRELPVWLKAVPLRRVSCEGVSGVGKTWTWTWTCTLTQRTVNGYGYTDDTWTGTGANWDEAVRNALENWEADNA